MRHLTPRLLWDRAVGAASLALPGQDDHQASAVVGACFTVLGSQTLSSPMTSTREMSVASSRGDWPPRCRSADIQPNSSRSGKRSISRLAAAHSGRQIWPRGSHPVVAGGEPIGLDGAEVTLSRWRLNVWVMVEDMLA